MIKEFRKYFGISQSQMAQYLLITRSQLSMIELNKRDLPRKKFIEFSALHAAINTEAGKRQVTHKEYMELTDAQEVKRKELIKREIRHYDYKLQTVRRKIKKLKANQERCFKIFEVMDELSSAAKKKDEGMVWLIKQDAKELQEANGNDALLKLHMQECAFEAILKFLETEEKTYNLL